MKSLLLKPFLQKAVIEGRKTQTRRLINPQPHENVNKWPELSVKEFLERMSKYWMIYNGPGVHPDHGTLIPNPKYQVGDICYLREGFRLPENLDHFKPSQIEVCPVEFKSGGTINCIGDSITKTQKKTQEIGVGKWRSPYHLPAHLARYFVKITNVKVERLLDISKEDAFAEGICKYGPFGEYAGSLHPNGNGTRYRAYGSPEGAFVCIWRSIYGQDGWKANPWVFAYTFQLCTRDGKIIENEALPPKP